MKNLKIGSLIISQRGMLIVAFLLFLTGVILGSTIAANFLGAINLFFLLPFLAVIWSVCIPSLEEEITEYQKA